MKIYDQGHADGKQIPLDEKQRLRDLSDDSIAEMFAKDHDDDVKIAIFRAATGRAVVESAEAGAARSYFREFIWNGADKEYFVGFVTGARKTDWRA